MRVKRFFGSDGAQALTAVKKFFGEDAVILETRQCPENQPAARVEILAAVDYDPDLKILRRQEESTPVANPEEVDETVSSRIAAARPPAEFELLRRDLALVKDGMTRLLRDSGLDDERPDCLHDLHRQLVHRRVTGSLVEALIEDCHREIRPHLGRSSTGAWQYKLAQAALARKLLDRVKLLPAKGLGRVLTLLGPTGVGKTTSLAKMAAFFSRRGERPGLISVDTFRLGAVAQIKAFARCLELPVRVVEDRRGLLGALHDFADLDRVLIDTMGRSARDNDGLAALFRLVQGLTGDPLLVLPAAVSEDDLLEILVYFRAFNCRGLLFTKLDETSGYGALLNAVTFSGLPLTFFADGQRVPGDLEIAAAERLVDLLLNITENN